MGVEIDRDDARDLGAVLAEHTDELAFSRTRLISRLFAVGTEFVSRSEARRLVRGLERRREVVPDFEGVRRVGRGSADEVLRVWATAHPEVGLIAAGMSQAVAFMIEPTRRAARGQA